MHKVQSWRTFLAIIIQDPKEKQRLIEELDITPITLTRWINGTSDPRPQNLRLLINALPQHRAQLLALLKEEKGIIELAPSFRDETPQEIPSHFYEQMFVSLASTTENLRFWSLSQSILQHALGQLDPEKKGLAVWVVSCMPPSGPFEKVRSLREMTGFGTSPWPTSLEHTAMFLGAESMAGNAVTLCRPFVSQNLDIEHIFLPFMRGEHEKSCAIYPILYAGRIAGVLLVSSAEYDHFASQKRTNLVQQYADLLALAFEPEAFYSSEEIALGVMPPPEIQQKYFSDYRRRLLGNMVGDNNRMNTLQAEQKTWQELEDELLKVPGRIDEEEKRENDS